MKSAIRKLEKEEIQSFVEIVVNAYPGMMQQTAEFKKNLVQRFCEIQESNSKIEFFGLFREKKLLGGMRIHHFTLNLYGRLIEAGGVGLVAVDLLHKKEKVAKEMMQYFMAYFKEKGVSLVMLYPFNPEFYKKMGFGYGTRMNHYYVRPSSFPRSNEKKELVFLDQTYKEDLKECYNRYAQAKHGMILKTDDQLEALYQNPNQKRIGFIDQGVLRGYILFHFKKIAEDNFLMNDLVITEMIYETPEALVQLCHFISNQEDQIHRVSLTTQDDSLEFLFTDPRNGTDHLIPSVYHEVHTAGTGLMYRIIDIKSFLKEFSDQSFHDVTCTVGVTVHDTFLNKQGQKIVLSFEQGALKMVSDAPAVGNVVQEIEIEIDISNLSSLLMGVVEVKKLFQYGVLKVKCSTDLDVLQLIFDRREKPYCTTAF